MQETEIEQIHALEADSSVDWFDCGDGRMPLRRWANPGAEKVVLVHGGSGSWTHWFANVPVLRDLFDVYAIDLPGLGDAAMCPVESDAHSAAKITQQALAETIDGPFHLVAFSWGCTVSAMIMKDLAPRLRSVLLAGSAAVGSMRGRGQMQPLIKRTNDMSRRAVLAAQRENLARLMIHDRSRIDELAVVIQEINTSKARFSSPQYAPTRLVLDGIEGTRTPLCVLYGERDITVYPDLDARRKLFLSVRSDIRFEQIPDAGHWVQYEQPAAFNTLCQQWVEANTSGD